MAHVLEGCRGSLAAPRVRGWLIDFGDDGPADPSGNEVVLGGGVVALAHDGKPIGRYDLKPGELTITLLMPPIAGEGEWQMIARFALPNNLDAHEDLIGVMQGIVPGDEAVAQPRVLRRLTAQA